MTTAKPRGAELDRVLKVGDRVRQISGLNCFFFFFFILRYVCFSLSELINLGSMPVWNQYDDSLKTNKIIMQFVTLSS